MGELSIRYVTSKAFYVFLNFQGKLAYFQATKRQFTYPLSFVVCECLQRVDESVKNEDVFIRMKTVHVYVCERETETERQRQTDRQTGQTHRERQSERQTDRDRQRGKQNENHVTRDKAALELTCIHLIDYRLLPSESALPTVERVRLVGVL